MNEVRKKDSFIPALSLVTENEDGKLVGQVVLYKTIITTPGRAMTELLLSPICVHPDYFCRAVFLCGDPVFYKKVGFKPTFEYGIFHVQDESKTAEWSMVRELYSGALDGISGTINTQ